MKNLTIKIGVALLTFFIGIGLATSWVIHSKPEIYPVKLGDSGEKPTLEMVFILDTTGSMGGLIDGAKQKIWGIVNEVMQSSSQPLVRIGLVAYRDRGDQYVTTILPLTNDLDTVYSTLMNYRAGGGGDTPENVRQALLDGVRRAGWSQSSSEVSQIIFLVGDAPPHNDYTDLPKAEATAAEASRRGMIVNTIQCGSISGTREAWQEIANRGQGQYFSIVQDGGVQVINTPYDEQLGELARTLGGTYVAYGGGGGAAGERYRSEIATRATLVEKEVNEKAAGVAKADRAKNKILNADAYVGDILQSIENGSVSIDSVKDEDLPSDLRSLSPAERHNEIEKRLAERKRIRAQIIELSKQRDDFLAAERKKQGGKEDGFDTTVAAALKHQLARKGLK